MQHTSKYQFKLIEGTDSFSPDPLNDNMEKVEEQFEAVEEDLANLAATVGAHGETARIAFGSYVGTGTYGADNPNSLTFGFTPAVVLLAAANVTYGVPTVLLRSMPALPGPSGSMTINLTWDGDSLSWYAVNNANAQGNQEGATYYYVAIGYEAE